jgi:hypothetical protein
MEKLKNYLELFLQSYGYFFCSLLGVKRFFKNPLFFFAIFYFYFLIKKPSSPTCRAWPHLSGLGPPVGAGLPGRTRPGGSVKPTRSFDASPPSFSSPSSSGNCVTFIAVALNSGRSRRS